MSGFGRILFILAALAGGLGVAGLRAQTVLGDPRDAARTFASNCSACHKSPQGLAKSGQVAGFLRQHYTTGPEMSAAMAAYLVAAGNAPARKGAAPADAAAGVKAKGKKSEQLAAHPADQSPEAVHQRTLRGKQQQHSRQHEEAAPQPPPAAQPAPPGAEEAKPAVNAALGAPQAPAETVPQPAPVVLDIPLPPMPEAPPPELTQSVFASSPLP